MIYIGSSKVSAGIRNRIATHFRIRQKDVHIQKYVTKKEIINESVLEHLYDLMIEKGN